MPSWDPRGAPAATQPTAADPAAGLHYIGPTLFQRAVQHWQVYYNRACTEDIMSVVLGKQSLAMFGFRNGMNVTAKVLDINDHMGGSLTYINPGDHVVRILAIYTEALLRKGAAYNVSLGELYIGFGHLIDQILPRR